MLEVTELSVAYGGIRAVRSASLVARVGVVTAIIGRNGAGKSSLVDGIAGLVRAEVSALRLDGADLASSRAWSRARAGIALVPEDRRIFTALSVRENLELGMSRKARREGASVEWVLDIFPALRELLNRPGDQISGGQQQMVAIGRGLMCDPKILILDEPSLGLAPQVVDEVLAAVVGITSDGLGVLLIEQNARAALEISANAYAMASGELRALEPGATLDNEDMAALYL